MTQETPLKIDKWDGGLLHSNAANDPRPEPQPGEDYTEWMKRIDWCHVQTLGSAMGGFNVEVWALAQKHTWIMCIDPGGAATNDILVEGFADYLDIMAMLAPIATASILEGDTLASIFRYHREAVAQREEMQKVGETIAKRVTQAFTGGDTPCDCPKCTEAAKQRAAEAN